MLSHLTYTGTETLDGATLDRLPESVQNVLKQVNGFIYREGIFHFRGAVASPEWHSLNSVLKGKMALSNLFSSLEDTDIPFGQDCVGDQFFLRGETVFKLFAETDEVESLGFNLEEFLDEIEKDPLEILSPEPLLQLHQEGKKLEPGQIIHVYPPFCTKEAAEGVSLNPVPLEEGLMFLADFARQLSGS